MRIGRMSGLLAASATVLAGVGLVAGPASRPTPDHGADERQQRGRTGGQPQPVPVDQCR
jgi:hypothetical protein